MTHLRGHPRLPPAQLCLDRASAPDASASPSADQCSGIAAPVMEPYRSPGTGGKYISCLHSCLGQGLSTHRCCRGMLLITTSLVRPILNSPRLLFLWVSIGVKRFAELQSIRSTGCPFGRTWRCSAPHFLAQQQQSREVGDAHSPPKTHCCGPRQLPLSPRSQGTPQFHGEGACTSLGYHTHRGWVTAFPKNTCSLVNPGSAYLKGHIRQLAYLL